MSRMRAECTSIAAELVDWEHGRIECIEALEEFPTERHARAYATWLQREGALEGLEGYAIGLDAALA